MLLIHVPATRFRIVLWLSVAAFFFAGCTTSPTSEVASANVVEAISSNNDGGFARAYEPIPFMFPADHGAHPAYRTEWWYYTGNLQDETGGQYGYQLTFFRSAITPTSEARPSQWATNQVYMAHFAITDQANNQHRSIERFSRGAAQLAGAVALTASTTISNTSDTSDPSPLYEIWLEDWSVRSIQAGEATLYASATDAQGAISLTLTLSETRPLILHGDQGLSQKSEEAGNASYYYSMVGVATQGQMTIDERTFRVSGLSWMDHEFGTSALSRDAVGWDWFSLQLDNGMILMLAQIRDQAGRPLSGFGSTLAWADGRQVRLQQQDFTLSSNKEWRSPRTGIVYPSGWHLSVPAYQLDLTITPLIEDQEMQVSFVYWEGAATAEGTLAGQPVAGRGYVELTGYGQTNKEYQR